MINILLWKIYRYMFSKYKYIRAKPQMQFFSYDQRRQPRLQIPSILFFLNTINLSCYCFLLFYCFLGAFYSSGSFWHNYFIGSNHSTISCGLYSQDVFFYHILILSPYILITLHISLNPNLNTQSLITWRHKKISYMYIL